jgi:hypothetical protein
MYTAVFLNGLRCRAMRAGVWFKALDTLERGIMTLTPKVVRRVKSPRLARILMEIVKKIRDAIEGGLARSLSRAISRSIRIAYLAVSWGYNGAAHWAWDDGFIRYLTILDLNMPTGWGF